MQRQKQVLACFCVLLCLAAIYVPLFVAGYAVAIAIQAVWNGQTDLAQSALLVTLICGILWISPIPAWHLAGAIRRRRVDRRSAAGQTQPRPERLQSWLQSWLQRASIWPDSTRKD
jgi:hypothetical protein